MAGKPAARSGDWHLCTKIDPGPKPHVGGPIKPPCMASVLIGGQAAARVGDSAICLSPFPDYIKNGSKSVFIGGRPAARQGDKTTHGGVILTGSSSVLIG